MQESPARNGKSYKKSSSKKTYFREKKGVPKRIQFDKETHFDKPKNFKNKFECQLDNNQFQGRFKPKNKSSKTYEEQTEEIDESAFDRKKAAGECPSCTWPAD
jgi:hypothetical protein